MSDEIDKFIAALQNPEIVEKLQKVKLKEIDGTMRIPFTTDAHDKYWSENEQEADGDLKK